MTAAATCAPAVAVGPVLEGVLARASDPEVWERFEAQLRSTGYCSKPVRLQGRIDVVDVATGECQRTYSTEREPDATLLKACGNRREAVCPSCAHTYRGDAFQLVAAGLRGGKDLPATVAEHPTVFLTLTAPSFGPVHSRRLRDGEPQRCRPRRGGDVCPHGVGLACREVHAEDDERLGEPLCSECFDYEHAVLWNALAPELWRRTAIQIARELARLRGLSERQLRRQVRLSYVKVAEYQRRGALHFHCVLRLDAAQQDVLDGPALEFDADLLTEAVLAAVRHVTVPSPAPNRDGTARELRWGTQVEVRPLDVRADAQEAAVCAAYIAKYATKSTEAVGGLLHRLKAEDLVGLKVRDHVRRLVECAWRLGGDEHLEGLRLRRWAHALGFRGHCFTKSRRYSTTFTKLRQARHEHVLGRLYGGERHDAWGRPATEGANVELKSFRFAGAGHSTLADAWLAESGAARLREMRAIARVELRAGPSGPIQTWSDLGGEWREAG